MTYLTTKQAITERLDDLVPIAKLLDYDDSTYDCVVRLFEDLNDNDLELDEDRLSLSEIKLLHETLGWLEGFADAREKTLRELLDEEGIEV